MQPFPAIARVGACYTEKLLSETIGLAVVAATVTVYRAGIMVLATVFDTDDITAIPKQDSFFG